jgi:hypothetical protein
LREKNPRFGARFTAGAGVAAAAGEATATEVSDLERIPSMRSSEGMVEVAMVRGRWGRNARIIAIKYLAGTLTDNVERVRGF